MRIEADLKLGFKDVLIRPKRSTLSSRAQVSLDRTFKFRHTGRTWTGIPIMAANMDTVGTFAMAMALARHGLCTAVHKHYPLAAWDGFVASLRAENHPAWLAHVAVSTGILESDLDKMDQILERCPEIGFICMDVANGYSEHFVEQIGKVRERHRDKIIMAGNVVTGEMVEQLLLSGADVVKVGIGPGSVCTTRVKTGVGYPQLSAIIECADAAHGLSGQIISDGGCTCAGDVAKAFGAGADFVMLGGMLAGHDEGGGEIVEQDGQRCVQFYGMSSKTAMEKYSGGVAEYRASEGKTVIVPYRGPVEETVRDLLGGLRSACTYVGAGQLKELTKRTTFVRVAEQHNPIFDE
ncbi:MAG: GMP reductase [Candidatus Contendobacter sp.]|jgi:GMP reductase|nr:GMP reductase [Candidatus Contendobacter sp.]